MRPRPIPALLPAPHTLSTEMQPTRSRPVPYCDPCCPPKVHRPRTSSARPLLIKTHFSEESYAFSPNCALARSIRSSRYSLLKLYRHHRQSRVLRTAFAALVASCMRLTHSIFRQYTDCAGWSSPVARWAHNPKVVGSNPTPATIHRIWPSFSALKSRAISVLSRAILFGLCVLYVFKNCFHLSAAGSQQYDQNCPVDVSAPETKGGSLACRR